MVNSSFFFIKIKYFILGVLNFLFIKLITSANLSLSDILYLQTLLYLSGSRLPVLKTCVIKKKAISFI